MFWLEQIGEVLSVSSVVLLMLAMLVGLAWLGSRVILIIMTILGVI